MNRILTVVILFGLLTSLDLVPATPTIERPVPVSRSTMQPSERTRPSLTTATAQTAITGASAAQAAEIVWAIDRFASAGLDLPVLTIVVHGSTEGCGGIQGVYRRDGQGDSIHLCNTSRPIILHELAHAWAEHDTTAETRRAFLDHEGIAEWAGEHVAYDQRGTERAARTMSLSLAEDALSVLQAGWLSRYLDGYQILTGKRSPRLESVADAAQPPL